MEIQIVLGYDTLQTVAFILVLYLSMARG